MTSGFFWRNAIEHMQHSRALFAGRGPIDCAKYYAQNFHNVGRFWPTERQNINNVRHSRDTALRRLIEHVRRIFQ